MSKYKKGKTTNKKKAFTKWQKKEHNRVISQLKRHAGFLKLAKRGFRLFPVKKNLKLPLVKKFSEVATTDIGQIQKWLEKNPDANMGIATGHEFWMLDIDEKGDDNGMSSLNELEQMMGSLRDGFVVRTTTGGLHIYFRMPKGGIPQGIKFMDGIDTRSVGGFAMAPYSVIDNKMYEIVNQVPTEDITEAPELLVHIIKTAFKIKGSKNDTARFRINHFPVGLPEGARNDTLFKYVCSLRGKNILSEDAFPIVKAISETYKPSMDDDELLNLFESAYRYENNPVASISYEQHNEIIEEYNKNYALLQNGGDVKILDISIDTMTNKPRDMEMSYRDFMAKKANDYGYNEDGDHFLKPSYWFKSRDRQEYNGLICSPSGNHPDDYYNLWHGFACEAVEGDCSLILKHIEEVICQGNQANYEFVLSWMADAIQNPDARTGKVIILIGKQGTGKTLFVEYFGKIFGNHYLTFNNVGQFTNNFNAPLKNKLLICLDEALWKKGDAKSEGIYKNLITGKKFLLEGKGVNAYETDNLARLIVTTNDIKDFPISPEERRSVFLEVGDEYMQNTSYFDALAKEMENGGAEALLYYLQNYEISVDLRANFQTQHMKHIRISRLRAEEKFVRDILKKGAFTRGGKWPEKILKDKLFKHYKDFTGTPLDHAQKTFTDHAQKTSFGRRVQKLFPSLQEKRHKTDGKPKRYYYLPPLSECREHFENMFGKILD